MSGNGNGNGRHTWDDEDTPTNSRYIAHQISELSLGIDAVATAQAEQARDIRGLKKSENSRVRVLAWALSLVLIPAIGGAIGAIWQGGRLIERIEQMSRQVDRLGTDHELRLRTLEHDSRER